MRFLVGASDGALDSSLQSLRVGTHDLLNLLAVLEDHEGGHGANTQLLSNIGNLINVDLVEFGIGVLGSKLLDLGSNDLARAAPGGETIEDDDVLYVGDLLVEVGLAVFDLISIQFRV